CVGAGRCLHLERELIAADHATGRMHQIDMADAPFRVERPLYYQRPHVPSVRQHSARTPGGKLQLEPCLPSRAHTVRCSRTTSSVRSAIEPLTTMRPLSRM